MPLPASDIVAAFGMHGLQRGHHRCTGRAPQDVLLALQVPQTHARPLVARVPFRHAENRIQANTADRHAFGQEPFGHHRQFVNPGRPGIAERTRLGNDDLATVTAPRLPDEFGEWDPSWVIVGQRHAFEAELPLIGPVVVQADDIEMIAVIRRAPV